MKKFLIILTTIILLVPTICFADEETVIKNASEEILNALAWVGYAIAFGTLIILGIKYMLAAAQEKANLKGKLPLYLAGIILIFFASTIALTVANVAGNNTDVDIIDKGYELGGLQTQNEPQSSTHISSSGVVHGGHGGSF